MTTHHTIPANKHHAMYLATIQTNRPYPRGCSKRRDERSSGEDTKVTTWIVQRTFIEVTAETKCQLGRFVNLYEDLRYTNQEASVNMGRSTDTTNQTEEDHRYHRSDGGEPYLGIST